VEGDGELHPMLYNLSSIKLEICSSLYPHHVVVVIDGRVRRGLLFPLSEHGGMVLCLLWRALRNL
jgi:hypothetical protein